MKIIKNNPRYISVGDQLFFIFICLCNVFITVNYGATFKSTIQSYYLSVYKCVGVQFLCINKCKKWGEVWLDDMLLMLTLCSILCLQISQKGSTEKIFIFIVDIKKFLALSFVKYCGSKISVGTLTMYFLPFLPLHPKDLLREKNL